MPSAAEAFGEGQGLRQIGALTEGITQSDLRALMQAAMKDAEGLIAYNLAKGTYSGRMRAAQLQAAVNGLGNLQSSLWGEVARITRGGIYAGAGLAADQQLDRDFLMGMPFNGLRQYAPTMHFNAWQSAEDIISRRTDGFRLADRIYANGRKGVVQAAKVVERGLLLQQSAKEIAAQVKGLYNPDVPGGQSYAAMRLARTEINNAHHTTTVRLADQEPWVVAYKWHLSSSHPKPDPCDVLAHNDHDGLGEGVFKKGNVPRKPHPQCFCYVTVKQLDRDEFLDRMANGQYDDYLDGMGVAC